MGSRFVSISEPVYSSLNTSISLITLLGLALISKLIKRKVANPVRAACGCPVPIEIYQRRCVGARGLLIV